MYEYLYGELTDISERYIVVDVNGIGYLVNVANPYHFESDVNTKKRIYVHQSVTDSSMTLYGFETLEDKQLFEQLLNVSGIGSKSALAIMAGNDNTGLVNAIKTEDVSFLVKFPGIGKKTAQQIILDLKDKIDKTLQLDLQIHENSSDTKTDPKLGDAINALEALGFTHKSVEKIKPELLLMPKETTTDQYISSGLKLLTK